MAGKKKAEKKTSKYSFKDSPKSYVSLLYGVLTVVVIFILIILGIRFLSPENKGKITDSGVTTVNQEKDQKGSYTIKEGDTLWKISEEKYGDGFKWVEIASANKISNPSVIEKGQKISIPLIAKEVKKAEGEKVEVDSRGKITEGKYTVIKEDTLWNIAVRAYADGYKWTEIAKANNLADPNTIHSGNVLTIPR